MSLPVSTVSNTSTVSVASGSSSVASQPPHVPLHIQVPTVPSTQLTSADRPHRPTPTPTPPLTVANHPQNPERSIIKDLLLNSRGFGVVQNPDGENGENLYTCKMCFWSFRDVDSLKYHMICYCQGSGSSLNSPSASSSAPISPVGSPSAAAASYIRSRSVSSLKNLARSSLNPPGRNPSSLCKLAKSQLTRPKVKPDNISLPAADSPSSSSSSSQTAGPAASGSKGGFVETVQNPLPSPGPLLGNTRLVESGKSPRKATSSSEASEGSSKRMRVASSVEPSTSSAIGSGSASNTLQLFGGEVEVVERSREGESKPNDAATAPANVLRYGSGGTFMQYNSGAELEDDESRQRELHFRRTLHSGGTLVEIAKQQEMPQAPRARSNTAVVPKPVAAPPTHFHFPPINSITAYNPLTLPAAPAPGQASQIVHGGKLIPFVQGMPGPNTLSSAGAQIELMPPTRTSQAGPNTQSLLTIVVPGANGPANSGHDSSAMHYKTPHQMASSASLLATVGSRGPYAVTSVEQTPAPPQPPVVPVSLEPPKKAPKNGLTRSEIWSPAKQQSLEFSSPSPPAPKKSFNFTRMADNISPRKKETVTATKADEVRHFHFDSVIAKSDILIKPPPPPPPPPATVSQDGNVSVAQDTGLPAPPSKPNRFLRPNTLPLKPGTFTPKRHHGITPTNNTMPLISPETPRPSKSCRELYFNGHAYTNIGLKSSTKPFYCTVNKTQPFCFQTQKPLSMYSNWQVHPENDPHPLGLKQITVMSLYDSNQHRDRRYAIAGPKTVPLTVVSSSSSSSSSSSGGSSSKHIGAVALSSSPSCVRVSPVEVKSNVPCPPSYVLAALASQQPNNANASTPSSTLGQYDQHRRSLSPYSEKSKQSDVLTGGGGGDGGAVDRASSRQQSRSASAERALSGGFESTEEYTYVRGRGRGKYVCNECGIRCKKPSMLKKHIRTHTDVRPYSCQYCSFHFKTKGNLTKHMKSKSHYKKCTELGLNPVPVSVDDDGADIDIEGDQQSISSERTSTIPGDSDTATDSDGDDTDDSEELKSRLPEHEAAEGLLSLSMTRPTSACSSLGTGPQPGAPGGGGGEPEAAAAYITQHINSYLTTEQQQRHGYAATGSPKPRAQSPSVAAKSDPPRRIITYGGGPKLEFNLLKHEQYYSDPNVGKRRRDGDRPFPSASDEAAAQAGDADDEDDTARPIDLTKKPRTQSLVQQPSAASAQHQYDRAPPQPLAMVTPLQSQQAPIELHRQTAQIRYDREQILQPHPVAYEERHPAQQHQQHQQQQQVHHHQQVIVRVSDVLAPITGAANLLTTLVSNTDKIPFAMGPFEPTGGATPGGAGVDENAYFHEYLKERALQDTRIKQSQMKPSTIAGGIAMRDSHLQDPLANHPMHEEVYRIVPQVAVPIIAAKATPPPAVIPPPALGATIPPSCPPTPTSVANSPVSVAAPTVATTSTERVYRIFSGKNERHRASPLAVESVARAEAKSPSLALVEQDKNKPSGEIAVPSSIPTVASSRNDCPLVSENASPMDTLAEIAAGSVKLDVTRAQPIVEPEPTVTSRPRCNSTNSTSTKVPPTVPLVPESAKTLASEYLKLAQAVTNVRKRTESESAVGTLGTAGSSDQEAVSDGVPTSVPSAAASTTAQQQPSAAGSLLPPVPPTVAGPAQGGSGTGDVGASLVAPARKVVVVGEESFKTAGVRGGTGGEFVGTPPTAFTPMHQEDGGRPVCEICNKKFHKLSQLSIHMNIHYMERKYRCEPCGTSFRSQGLYLKHERSATHRNKVSMTTTFGVATDSNPRPFYCRDCEVGFRIHGHLAKHLRSKMHVLKLECLGKLPFGTYTEIERSGTNLTEIDTSDCENSLSSLKRLATRLNPSLVANGVNGSATAERDDDQRNINNNVKRKADDKPAAAAAIEMKRARYGAEGMEEGVSLLQQAPVGGTSNHALPVEGAAANSNC
uniref:Uncharacterized protein n=1 Tax=Anopheles melas TaxID=34690 RepID=A0A182TDB2_9DIPT